MFFLLFSRLNSITRSSRQIDKIQFNKICKYFVLDLSFDDFQYKNVNFKIVEINKYFSAILFHQNLDRGQN